MQVNCICDRLTPMKVKHCGHASHQKARKSKEEIAFDSMRKQKMRITNPRKEIVAILAQADQPLSCEEIFSLLKKGGDLVTVYRNMISLEESLLVRRCEFGDGIRRYEIMVEDHHHHYVRCVNCGQVEPFEGCSFEEEMEKSLTKKGYKKIRHNLEVLALCAKCAK